MIEFANAAPGDAPGHRMIELAHRPRPAPYIDGYTTPGKGNSRQGQAENIRNRIRGHMDKFWYKSPIVETAAYVRVDDALLRGQLEETLIKFLKSNAVINRQLVKR